MTGPAARQGRSSHRRGKLTSRDRRVRSVAVVLALVAAVGLPTAAEASDELLELGRSVFVEIAKPACGVCHTLADAGASGPVGPNLDETMPTEERVAEAVRTGFEAMPAFEGRLTDEQIEAVAHYVAAVAGKGG